MTGHLAARAAASAAASWGRRSSASIPLPESAATMESEQFIFGDFLLDLGRRELLRRGIPVSLRSRALDVLCVLAAARGEVVTKDELMARVWPGVVVEEINIQVHISGLRKALGEGSGGESFVDWRHNLNGSGDLRCARSLRRSRRAAFQLLEDTAQRLAHQDMIFDNENLHGARVSPK